MRNKQHEDAHKSNLPIEFNFSKESQTIRVELRYGEPWFAVKDVCDALGISNSRDAISNLDDDEKGVGSIDTLGGVQTMQIVNESGLYSLIFQSRKPEAKKFRKWVTNEVLPSIRKTGSYGKAKIDIPQIDSVLPYVDQQEYEGEKVYGANDIFKLLGRNTGCHIIVRARELAKQGRAFKLISTASGQEKWFVKRNGIGRILNVKVRTASDIAIVKQLKEGGLL